MTLLDRFRTAPRHKHPDPAVRVAFVSEIPLDDRDLIASIAREDEDSRVRRAAVAKLMDPAALGRIAQEDADEGVRAQAATMLRDIALDVFEGLGEAESLDAVDALADARALSQIAKSSVREIVALRALSCITDPHAWGSVARHGVTEAARRGALTLLRERGDDAEIVAVAMNGEFKDVAVSAVDLLTDREQLEGIAARGKNKTAAKRARTIIREADERAAQDAAMRAAEEGAMRAAEESAMRAAEAAAAPPPAETAPASIERPEAERVESAGIDRPEAAAKEAEAEAAKEAEEVARNLRRALEQAARAAQAARESERRHARLSELAEEGTAAAADADLVSARKHFGDVRRQWNTLSAGITVDAAIASRFREAEAALTARDTQAREAETRGRREALTRLQQLLTRVEPLAPKTDVTLKAAERALRDVRTALAGMPALPTRQDADEVARRLKAAQAALIPKLQELREADDWKRFANAGIQEQLCARMEALQAVEDPQTIATTVHELQEEWREAADVPRAQADALWRRFKTAHDAVWPRCEAFFAAEAQARVENVAKKTALCEQAEALAESTSWIQTAEEIKRLQAEWKTVGPVARGREKAIWERFRAACDRFFTRRHEDLARRKTVWAENLGKKIALCEQAEALAQSTDWDRAAAEIRRLQVEWKAVGPIKKNRSDAIWQRFRSAGDLFFSRFAQRHDIAREERIAAREAICAELSALAPEAVPADQTADAPPADLLANMRAIRSRWQQEIAARGVDPERARALDERFAAAFARVLSRFPSLFADTDLDPDVDRKRMETLVGRIEALALSVAGPAAAESGSAVSPTTRLASMLKEALAANTIGGKVEDDSRWRAAAEEVRHAQANWSRIGMVADEVRKPLLARFQRACRRITENLKLKNHN